MRLSRLLWLLGGLGLSVSTAAFAQCNAMSNTTSPSTTSAKEQPEDRTVDLTLMFSRSGGIRDVRVLRGPLTLRAAAIKAVNERKYKHRLLAGSLGAKEMMVEVKFPQDNGAPEIRQVLSAGVSGCVTGPKVVRVLPPELNRFFIVEPVIPVLVSEPTK